MNLTSTPLGSLNGTIICPGDKSISQRVLMIGALMNDDMQITGFLRGEDPLSTMRALNQMGAEIQILDDEVIQITHKIQRLKKPGNPLNLGNSGTGLRLMLGMTAGLGIEATFCGDTSLSGRPMGRVIDPLRDMGAEIDSDNGMLPIFLHSSTLSDAFIYELPVASAQVKSCILLAGLASQRQVTVIETLQTRDHTERMLQNFGAHIATLHEGGKNIISLDSRTPLKAKDYHVVGDISSAAFLIVGCLISNSNKLTVCGVGMNPSRIGILTVLKEMGAHIEINNSRIESGEPIADLVVLPSKLKGTHLKGEIIPNIIDEIPILAIAAAFADGETLIQDAVELRVKESDRLSAVSQGLSQLGVIHENFDDGIKIQGSSQTLHLNQRNISLTHFLFLRFLPLHPQTWCLHHLRRQLGGFPQSQDLWLPHVQ